MAKKRVPSTKTGQCAATSKSSAAPVRPASSSASASRAKTPAVLTHEMIAKRAYAIWERKGRPVGQDLENWKQAERELRAELGL